MRQLTGTDALMLYSESPNAQNLIAPIAIYDSSTAPGGHVSFEQILQLIESRLDVSDSFRERLVRVPFGLDRPYWVRDENFDLEYHVRHIALPPPGDWEQFCKLIARLGATQLDMSRPPWELYIIDGIDNIEGVPSGAFASMLKLHHAAVDGVSGSEIISAIHDVEGGNPALPTRQVWRPEPVPSDVELVARSMIKSALAPWKMLRPRRPSEIIQQVRETFDQPKGGQPMGLRKATRFNRKVSPHRSWGSQSFSLDDIKALRAKTDGAKVNDIGLALVGGALRRYLESKNELPDESLVALMPISIRPTQIQKAMGPTVEASAGGNQFAMVPISMSTDIDDPLARIAAIQLQTAAAKEQGAIGARRLAEMSEAMPGALMGTAQRAMTAAVNRFGRAMGVHTTVTNVPGPQVPLYLCGARAVRMDGMAPVVDGMGIIHGIGSYDGEIPFTFTADRDAMPDPHFYEECLLRSYEEIAASTKAAPRREPATAAS